MEIILIAAVSQNGVIGRDGGIPWTIPGDLKRFKELTTNHICIMGRKTFESIGKPLPNRINIVLSRNPEFMPAGATRAASLDEALEKINAHNLAVAKGYAEPPASLKVFIIGGEAVYREALPIADKFYLTKLHCYVEGDACFPDFHTDNTWLETKRQNIIKDGILFATYIDMDRIK